MLVEVKAKVARIVNGKPRKKTETYVVDNCEFFVTAEHQVSSTLAAEQEAGTVESYELISLRQSSIKEIASTAEELQDHTFIATLCDIFLSDDGTEKPIKYKVLLGASTLTEAHQKTQELARQGYNMSIEGIKQVDYIYI